MTQRLPVLRFAIVIFIMGMCGTASMQGRSSWPVIGVNYDPLPRNPTAEVTITEAQISADLEMLADKFTTIRIYESQALGEFIVSTAGENRLDVVIQAWLSDDMARNDEEIQSVIALANQYNNVVGVVVGSQVLSRDLLTVDQLLEYVGRVREAVPDRIPIGYTDLLLEWVQNPVLAGAVSWIGLDSYGFLTCQTVNQAVQYSINQWALLVSNPAFQGKDIVLMETGWPTSGSMPGCADAAQPSVVGQTQFVNALISTVAAADLDTYMFEFADSPWRCSPDVNYACHWGLVDAERRPKEAWMAMPEAVRTIELLPLVAQVDSDSREAVNCRVEPGLEQTVMVEVENGEPVTILDRSTVEEWVRVESASGECWIHHSLLLVDGRPVPPASQTLELGTTFLDQLIRSSDASQCTGASPGQIAIQTWRTPDVEATAACLNTLQTWMEDVARQQSTLRTQGVCDTQPSAVEADVQSRFQTIWALDNVATAYYNLGVQLRRAGEYNLAYQAFLYIIDDMSCAWAYDSSSGETPFFWSVAAEAQDQIDSLPLGSQSMTAGG
ncbi:MAG: SH3 domain-containing protein [Chloroflexi bacterium]|nr:SH3 domain-containing protein [Chloroflexota bacterium]